MNLDEFAFFNQQLARMLRDGIPLEGALRKLSQDLRRGALRNELTALETDLSQGVPLADALDRRDLPPLYKRLLVIGARSSDLPASLTLLADYFQRQHMLWTRLKGLMVYPVLVLLGAFFLSVLLWQINTRFVMPIWSDVFNGWLLGPSMPFATQMSIPLLQNAWVFPVLFALPLGLVLLLACVPALRQAVLNRLPGFREARLAQTAMAAHMLLKGGIPFPEAVGVIEDMQPRGRLRNELASWKRNIAAGVRHFASVAAGGRFFPPLFIWMVGSTGEDLPAGFRQAAEIYEARATQRAETMLYAALPVMVMGIGLLVLLQAFLVVSAFLVFVQILNSLG